VEAKPKIYHELNPVELQRAFRIAVLHRLQQSIQYLSDMMREGVSPHNFFS
jgi:hypothetical protein